MALIKCPECGNDVSDKSRKCPHCGLPIGNFFSRNKKIIWAITSIISVIVICAIFISINNFISSPEKIMLNDTKVKYQGRTIALFSTTEQIIEQLGEPDEVFNSHEETWISNTDITFDKLLNNILNNSSNDNEMLAYDNIGLGFYNKILIRIFNIPGRDISNIKTYRGINKNSTSEDFLKIYKENNCYGEVEELEDFGEQIYSYDYNIDNEILTISIVKFNDGRISIYNSGVILNQKLINKLK